jgi:hypothetical protein
MHDRHDDISSMELKHQRISMMFVPNLKENITLTNLIDYEKCAKIIYL